jgi:N-acetylglucosaminyldiphosphoundecaprenol N-acetyl-beta-D-mannosaminyltransferase
MKEMRILGIKITPAEPQELHAEITRLILRGGPGFVLSGNVHGINLACQIGWLRAFYNLADVVRVDGAGVVLAARLLGHQIPKRLTWADWGWMLADYLAKKGHSLYLLGGPEGAASESANKLKQHAPGLKVVGTHHGYFAKDGPENDEIINHINSCRPDILLAGMGMPLQESWLLKNYRQMDARVFITAGAAFEFLSGSVKRCPKWMGDLGLEWLFRLSLEPKRMARRYLWGNTAFIFNIFMERLGLMRF